MRLAFTIAYLGDHFFGSQQQNSNRTVEGEFIATCKRLNLFDDWREAKFAFAGRTDRGVHAFGQVCSFTTDLPQRAVECLNLQLPRDCWCRGYAEVDEDFHPRYAARSRTYRYYLIEPSLDITPMAEAARYFEGTHNFSSIARTEGRNPLRTLHRVRVWKEDPFIIIEVQGESFLWHMVRGMTTVLREVGAGTADSGKVTTLLEKTMKDRVSPAPAEGLVLWEVDCGIRFIPVPLGERHEGYLTVEQKKHQLQGKIISLLHCHDTFSPTPRAS
ncbi:MAG: tRNA pseudouridine(38-40) synthase TruA [Methanomicrobiales archaeon]|nr:tRNA pseudouridine(38-40) synthase TruA [Methanomicrobiales archaeon]